MTGKNALKACPFCGPSGNLAVNEDDDGLVRCRKCGCENTVDYWNTRASGSQEVAGELVEALIAAKDSLVELTEYEGGADNALEDPHVMDRACDATLGALTALAKVPPSLPGEGK